jgi:hypothetical protein
MKQLQGIGDQRADRCSLFIFKPSYSQACSTKGFYQFTTEDHENGKNIQRVKRIKSNNPSGEDFHI